MQKIIKTFVFLLVFSGISEAQNITYNGYVRDSTSGEPLIGATVFVDKNTGTITNKFGFFSLNVPQKTPYLQLSYVGYKPQKIAINTSKTVLQVMLSPIELETIVIRNETESSQEKAIGLLDIPIERLKAVPMALGETDIIKALAFTPGVTVGNEGTAGLLVRGGSPDQNLILLDDAPLYNQSHLFGFASTFNADAIKKVDLYKGAFPARFGGRLSSVIDVTMKDGNDQKRKKELNIGLVSSRFFIEGPLRRQPNNKTTFMLSARSTYFTLFLLPTIIAYNNGSAEGYFNYWLYDVNAKITHRLSKSQTLSFSMFRGQDYWYGWDGGKLERSKFTLNWGNTTSTVKYNQILNPKLFLNVMGVYTKYNYGTGFDNYLKINNKDTLSNSFHVSSGVRDFILKTRFEYFPYNHWQVYFGTESVLHKYQPSFTKTTFPINEAVLAQANQPVYAFEQTIYAENDIRLLNVLRLNVGARGVLFNVQGQTYSSFEPRVSANYVLPHHFAFKASYSQMRQFIHLLNSSTVGIPNDLWVPTTKNVAPQTAKQISVGISKDFPKRHIQVSVEAYRKDFNNLIDFKTGTDFMTEFDKSWENKIEKNGIGKASGIEVFINKTAGDFSGWLSYTYAINQRKFGNINDGQWFRANYDRRHNVALNYSYSFSKKISFSAVWQYMSGQPATVPVAIVRNIDIPWKADFIYKDRNNYQTLDYHRLDVGFNFTKNTKKGNQRTWSVGAINAYNRRNPLFLEIRSNSMYVPNTWPLISLGFDNLARQSSFFPVLPFISYSLKIK